MPRKEKTNAKTWERERRNRMNLYFKGLADLLPPHQDGKNRNKVDILIQASKYIKDLTNRTEELFHAHAVDAHKEELNRLKKLVAQLYSRTQLLSTLLKDAGITVPAEPALEKISPLKWSNKINVEDAEKYLDRFKERKTEKRKSKSIAIKTPLKKKLKNGNVPILTKKSANDKEPTDSIKNGPAEDQENHVNSSIKNKNGDDKSLDPNVEAESRTNTISASDKETSKSTGPNLRSGVRELQSRRKNRRRGTKSRDNGLSLEEKLCKVIKTQQQPQHTTQSQSIASLIPGTLILSGVSKIMPLVTPMTSNIIVNGTTQSGNSIILGNTQSNPMIVMQPLVNRIQNTTVVSVQNEISTMNAAAAAATTVQKVTLNTVPSIQTNVGLDSHDWVSNVKTIIDATKIGGRKGILPKGKEITKTTMAYKVPIPAVHRDGKLNNRNFETNNDTKKSTDMKNKMKKLKSVRNKKLSEIKNSDKESMKSKGTNTHDETIADGAVRKSAESCGKKRRNISDNNEDTDTDIPPIKMNKKNLPETCESIENLRHVVEKIGDNSTEIGAIVAAEQQKNLNDEKHGVEVTNTDSILKSVETIVSQSKIDESISNCSVKISSIEIQSSSPEKRKETTSSLSEIKLACVSMNTSTKSCQVSDAIFTSQNKSTITKATDPLPPPSSATTLSSPQHFHDVAKVITEAKVNIKKPKEISHIKTGFDNLLTVEPTQQPTLEHSSIVDNTKIILNLDTNTTTTMKPEPNAIALSTPPTGASDIKSKICEKDKERAPKNSLSYNIENSFIPIGSRTEALHSDLSNDLFASLQVPSSSHNPESISPTAAFLMAFPLVSSLNGKTEVLEEDMKEDLKYHSHTPPMLLQIGTIEPNSFKLKQSIDNGDTKCTTEKNPKTESGQSTSLKTNAETSLKPLPKIVNSETFKERLYKVVPYTSPSKKLPESPTPCSINIPTSSTNAGEDNEKKIVTKSNTTLCATIPKYDTVPSSSSSSLLIPTTSNELPKYNANIRYPLMPDYLPSYSTFTVSTSENQMLPLNNSIVSSYSTSQIPVSQTYPVYSVAKDVVQTSRNANFMNPPPPLIPTKEINSVESLQTTLPTERQECQARTLSSEVSAAHPPQPSSSLSSSSSSSQSLQYNYSSRPKDPCAIQTQQTEQSIYPGHQNKNDPLCLMSTERASTSGTYRIHGKDSVNQMPYQAFSMGQKDKSSNAHETISNQLIRTSSSSYIPPRTADPLTSHSAESKDTTQNSYQSYLPIGQRKDSSPPILQQPQQRSNDVQLQSLGQSCPTQVKQISSNDSFDNIQQQQQQHRSYATARKHDTFVSTNSTDQRIKSLSEGVNKCQSQQDNNNQQRIETLFQTKRNDTQTYIPYSHEQKKIFDINTSNNSQITKSHALNVMLPRYPIQQQQQQTCVATSDYSQGNVTENMTKTTTTVANNSSNFSILSWTTFSPICGGSNNNINNNNNRNNNNNTNNNNSNDNNNNNSNNNNNNNNLVQFEPVAEHVDNTQGHKICDNFSYNTLHKGNIGYGNLMSSETTFTADTATIPSSNVDKTKNKVNSKEDTTFDDATPNKAKNPVQSPIVPPPQQQQQQQKPARTLSQNQNVNDNFKFSGNESNNNDKNKSKFPMDSAYTQTEFGAMDQHSRHQHAPKSHQIVTSKAGKTPAYAIAGFDSQVAFDIAETVTSSKCAADIYSGSNYKYPGNKEQNSQIKYQTVAQSQPSIIQQDSSPYNSTKQNISQQQSINNTTTTNNNNNKIKPVVQQQTVRPPVNWMMTPEIKHNTNITDIILPPIGKELEFCPNNIFGQTPSYNQTTSNQFYNNYDATVSSSHTFPNVSTLQTDSRRIIDSFYTDDQQFSWSPTKNPPGTETMKTIEQQVVVPSTLPTLVGDLALGTNIPEKQNFLYNQMSSRPSNELTKPTGKEKETNVGSRDFQVMLNPQTVQHTSQGGSFLSVSQLVEHEKEKTHHHQQQNQHTHHHPQQQQQQQQAPQNQTRKPQRKTGNTSPRGGAKRQIEMRKQTSDQQLQPQQQQQTQTQAQQQQADDQKVSSTHGFTNQSYQQSQQQPIKCQQNDALWRNRNCKSNYTAEALIGVNNTTIQDTNNTDKQLHTPAIKFSTEYSQNKFPTSLSTSDMVMPTINYLSNPDDGNGYGQMMNQNFNHPSYTYSTNSNIYPSTNFMAGISNAPSSYPMMPLHDNPTDYLETNSFLLPNVGNVTSSKTAATITSSVTTRGASSTITVSTNAKTHQQYGNNNVGKQQTCTDKRNSYSTASKKSKRKPDTTMNNLDFAISGVTAPIEDYHPHAPTHHHHHHHHPAPPHPPPPSHPHHHHHHAHTTSFLATPHANTLYQNHSHTSAAHVGLPINTNRTRGNSAASSNSVAMAHHPSGTSLTNFNLSTIFPEINDKVTGYKATNAIVPGLSQSSNHPTVNYMQRANYTTNNTLGHVPQISESTQFTTNLPPPPPPASVLHYKAT